jgi:signal transduction histidine kinase/ActR/RegA family two-component response regulator
METLIVLLGAGATISLFAMLAYVRGWRIQLAKKRNPEPVATDAAGQTLPGPTPERNLPGGHPQLVQARKMAALGTATAAIAHDFNNILTPILGYAEIGLDFCEENSELQEFILEIRTAALRAKDLTGQILTYSRQTNDEISPTHVSPIVKEIAKQQAALLAPAIEVRHIVRAKEDRVMASPAHIHQILMNLIANAVQALHENGGRLIEIELTCFDQGVQPQPFFPSLPDGAFLQLSVKDNGPGIPESIRDRIFDPFFSTRPREQSAGMGLAFVQAMAATLKGAIALDTGEGSGTTFRVALPLLPQEQQANVPAEIRSSTGEKNVLFVDDESSITNLARPLLQSLGYAPIICKTATDALLVLETEKNNISLLVTDLVMPEMGGVELARAARDILPQMPVIIMTGFPDKLARLEAVEAGVKAMLLKPVTRAEMADVFARVLNGENLLPI